MSSDFRKSRDLIDQVIEEAKAIEDLSSEGYQWPVDSESPPEKSLKEREHGRTDLSGKSIELHFQSGEHFAKSYIENISVGGLFVRSEEPRRLGELIDVSFSLPGGFAQAPLHLSVRAKVARVAKGEAFAQLLSKSIRPQDFRFVQLDLDQWCALVRASFCGPA